MGGTLSSGNHQTVGDSQTVSIDGQTSVIFTLVGAPIGATVVFESTTDGQNWAFVSSASAAGDYSIPAGTAKQIRARLVAIKSGQFHIVAAGDGATSVSAANTAMATVVTGALKDQLISNRSVIFAGINTAGTPSTRGTSSNSRLVHTCVKGATEVTFEFYGIYINATGNEVPIPNSVTVTGGLGIGSSMVSQITFNGSTSGVLAPYGVLRSDPIPLDIAPGGTFFSNWFATVSAGQAYPIGVYIQGSAYPGSKLATTTTETDQTMNASYAFVANPAEDAFGPNMVYGKPLTRIATVVGIGDSQTWGLTAPLTLGRGHAGVIFDTTYPYANGGEPTSTATNMAGTASMLSMRYVKWADVVRLAYGTNDFGNLHHTLSVYQSDLLTSIAKIKRRGNKGIIVQTITPRCSASTDSWVLGANMTVLPEYQAAGAMQQANAWIRDGMPLTGTLAAGYIASATGSTGASVLRVGSPLHPVGYVSDVGAVVEHPTIPGAWKDAPDGTTATRYTADGIHLYTTAVNAVVAANQAGELAYVASVQVS